VPRTSPQSHQERGRPLTLGSNLRIPQDALRLATVATLGKTDLEWTSLHVGQIADYLGTPHLRSHMGPYAINVDMAHRAAAIPGSGDDVIAFTYTGDIARFVEAALGLPRWEREMHCYSDRRSLNEVVKLAEEATGELAAAFFFFFSRCASGYIG
jgi:nucleoside-diphosphate-sugar epimerase